MTFSANCVAVIFATAATALAALAPGAAFADAEAGKKDFGSRCAACHGPEGLGDGPISHYFTTPPPNLTLLTEENGGVFPRDQIIAVIDGRDWLDAHGGRAMPIWGEIFEAQARKKMADKDANPEDAVIERLEDIVDFIESIQK